MKSPLHACFYGIILSLLPLTQAFGQYPATTLEIEPATEIFRVTEQMPIFPDCAEMPDIPGNTAKNDCSQRKMTAYIQSQLQYPEAARKARVKGRVTVQFIVEADGTVSNIACIGDIGYGCCEEAVRVIETMNALPERWSPGKHRGRPVRVQIVAPVQFKL